MSSSDDKARAPGASRGGFRPRWDPPPGSAGLSGTLSGAVPPGSLSAVVPSLTWQATREAEGARSFGATLARFLNLAEGRLACLPCVRPDLHRVSSAGVLQSGAGRHLSFGVSAQDDPLGLRRRGADHRAVFGAGHGGSDATRSGPTGSGGAVGRGAGQLVLRVLLLANVPARPLSSTSSSKRSAVW